MSFKSHENTGYILDMGRSKIFGKGGAQMEVQNPITIAEVKKCFARGFEATELFIM